MLNLETLKDRKTYLGCVILSILMAIFGLDRLIDGQINWMPLELYGAIGGLVSALTGCFMRSARL